MVLFSKCFFRLKDTLPRMVWVEPELKRRCTYLFSFTNKPDGTVTDESRVPVPGKFRVALPKKANSSHLFSAHSIVLRVATVHSEMKRRY